MGCAESSQSIQDTQQPSNQNKPIKAKQMPNGEENKSPEKEKKEKKDKKDKKSDKKSKKKKKKSIETELMNIEMDEAEFLKEMENFELKGEKVKHLAKLKTYKGVDHMDVVDAKDPGGMFEVEDVGQGDEFMAVLPWKGAIKEPTNHPPPNAAMPNVDYKMEFVYGYKCEEVRQNLFYNHRNKPVYMTAALGIIFDPKTRTQTFFGGGATQNMVRKQKDESMDTHTDDIMALAINQERELVATGQVGLAPIIFIWDAATAMKKGMMRLPKGSRSVTALGFNRNSTYLAAADLHNDHNVYVYKVEDGQQMFSLKSGPDKVFMLHWNTIDDVFCTVGPKAIYFWKWTVDPARAKHKGTFGNTSKQTNLACVTYDDKGIAYTGGQNGCILTWSSTSLQNTYQTHKGVVHCIRFVQKDASRLIISGASDQKIVISDANNMATVQTIEADSCPRSLDMGRFLLVGFRNGSIAEYMIDTQQREVIMHSHHDGEVWGLCHIPGSPFVFTSGDDNKIFKIDIDKRRVIQKGLVSLNQEEEKVPQSKSKFKGGASTLSSEPPVRQSRALAFSNVLQHLAVANNEGGISIRLVSDEGDLNKEVCKMKNSKEWIECMAYNPKGDRLGVGSHDNYIYIYNAGHTTYPLYATLRAHSSFITCFDWSADGSMIRSNCGAYELLFFNVQNKKQDSGGASGTVGTQWATMTCKLGWSVQGIYPPGCDGTHVNGVDQSQDEMLIATGDDYGLVNIYRNPALEGHVPRSYRGHSEHVTRVMFMKNDEYLISIGGMDQTTIQWKREPQ